MKSFLIRGVPASIQFDSWWMDSTPPPRHNEDGSERPKPRGLERAVLLAALILLADFMIWQVTPGISLALFGLCLLLAGLCFADSRNWGGVILGAVFFLPVIEHVQFISLCFFFAGLLLGGAWIGLQGWPGLRQLGRGALRLLLLVPLQNLQDLRRGLPALSSNPKNLHHLVLGWALPAGLGLIFLSLMINANPLLESWFIQLDTLRLPDPARVFFWVGIAFITWPFLRLARMRQRLALPPRDAVYGPRRLPGILNPAAIRRSLILFNLLFAMQTLMDATYLWGGAALPDGMSYAQYAHRGAYPLLVTALLAGTFALIARPFTNGDRLLRLALLFWIGQTVLLVISSILRLELYIEIYGLTRLRLAAGIWMALIACSLAMLIWQIIARHSAAWLLARGAMLALVTLYACMFLSFDRAIARYNLTHDVPLDNWYICNLGSAAFPEIQLHNHKFSSNLCGYKTNPPDLVIWDWREWGFRDWRVMRNLAAIQTTGAPL